MTIPSTTEKLCEELARLYRLREEGKHVDSLIAELEAKLFELAESDNPCEGKENDDD